MLKMLCDWLCAHNDDVLCLIHEHSGPLAREFFYLSLLSAIILICTNTASIQTAVVGVNTSPDYVNPSGVLAVVDIENKSIVYEIDIMGQPDAVDVSKDEQYIVVAIENERDEDLGDGVLPQMPAGFVVIIDTPTGSTPEEWTVRQIDMTGLDILYPEDPEPEYVSINSDNIAVVTMQENNGIALIDLASGEVTASFNAGDVDIDQIDTVGDSIIMQTDSATLLREPDGITWIGTEYYATANEG